MIRCEIIGNLAADVVRRVENGRTFATFRVASSARMTDPNTGEITEVTTWVSCAYNNPPERLLPYLKKGTKVFLRGPLSARVYKDRAGITCAGLNMSVWELELCGGLRDDRSASDGVDDSRPSAPPSDKQSDTVKDNLPF